MHRIECTPPPDKAVTPAVVAPIAAGRGECASQKRHQFRRSASYTRSFCLILSSCAANAMAMPMTTTGTSQNHSANDLSAVMNGICTVPPADWATLLGWFLFAQFSMMLAAYCVGRVFFMFLENVVERLPLPNRRDQVDADFQETRQ